MLRRCATSGESATEGALALVFAVAGCGGGADPEESTGSYINPLGVDAGTLSCKDGWEPNDDLGEHFICYDFEAVTTSGERVRCTEVEAFLFEGTYILDFTDEGFGYSDFSGVGRCENYARYTILDLPSDQIRHLEDVTVSQLPGPSALESESGQETTTETLPHELESGGTSGKIVLPDASELVRRLLNTPFELPPPYVAREVSRGEDVNTVEELASVVVSLDGPDRVNGIAFLVFAKPEDLPPGFTTRINAQPSTGHLNVPYPHWCSSEEGYSAMCEVLIETVFIRSWGNGGTSEDLLEHAVALAEAAVAHLKTVAAR